jgi:hypothetical protein
LLATVHDRDRWEQPALKAVALQLQEEVRFLPVQEVLFVQPPDGLECRAANEKAACVEKGDGNRF